MGNSSSQTEECESSEQPNPLNKSDLEEESNNENEKLCPKDKSDNIAIAPPKFITRNDFIRTWFSWKNEFLAFVKSIDKAEANKQMWGLMLLNHMGPIGQEIYRTFSFHDKGAQEDIDVLIKKFDTYCIYEDKRKDDKDIDKYINDLKLTAVAHNYADPTSIMKEKVIQDISTQRFTEEAALFIAIQHKENNFLSFLESLDLDKIILLWKQCKDLMAQGNDEEMQERSTRVTSTIKKCNRCGTKHKRNQCLAWGMQCSKCQQFNHLTEYCKIKYTNDCTTLNLERGRYDVQRWVSWLQDAAKAIIYIGNAIYSLYKQLFNMCIIVNRIYISCPVVMLQ